MLSATGSSGDSSFEYDELGRMKTRVDASDTARFTYDKGRLHTATDSITGTGQANMGARWYPAEHGSFRLP